MQAITVFVKMLLLLSAGRSTFQQFAGCRESYYLYKGSCTPCPDRCAACNSELNCTGCKGNYYGPVCQHTCQQECKDLCHKVHGYCTYGCLDGFFPEPNSPLCASCPPRCRKCKSMTECFECIPGYHGNTCDNPCSSNCEMCNKTTGACLVCDENYFYKDVQCHRCQDGCESCYDSENCSRCGVGYLKLINGQCIQECPREITDAALSMDDLEYTRSHDCMNRTGSQRFEVKTKKSCIQYIPCSSNIVCPSENDEKSGCGTVMSYQCVYVFNQRNEKNYTFEHNCTIKEQDHSAITLCVTNKDSFSVIKLSTVFECGNEEPSNATTQSWMAPMSFLITLTVVYLFGFLLLVLVITRYRHLWTSRRKGVDDIKPKEDEAVKMVHNESEEFNAETCLNHSLEDVLKIDETGF